MLFKYNSGFDFNTDKTVVICKQLQQQLYIYKQD